jgi:hypothetical protein
MNQYSPLIASEIPAGFGTFPYLILQVYRNVFVQIPIVFDLTGNKPDTPLCVTIHLNNAPSDVFTEPKYRGRIKETHYDTIREMAGKNIANRNIAEGGKYKDTACMVLSPDYAIYFDKGIFEESNGIPEGGALMNVENQFIAINSQHYCSDEVPFIQSDPLASLIS